MSQPTGPKKSSWIERVSSYLLGRQKSEGEFSLSTPNNPLNLSADKQASHEKNRVKEALLEKTEPNKKEAMLKVYNEIITSEKTYLENLKVLVNNSVPMLEAYNKTNVAEQKDKATPAELSDFFSKIEAVYSQNEALLKVLQTNPDSKEWAKQFSQLEEAYCNYMISKEKVSAKGLPLTVEKAFVPPVGSQVGGFDSYSMQPAQRLPRYSLLLSQLQKELKDEHKSFIVPAMQSASAGAEKMNNSLQLYSAIQQNQHNPASLDLASQLKPLPPQIVFNILKSAQFNKMKFTNKAEQTVAQTIYATFQKEAQKIAQQEKTPGALPSNQTQAISNEHSKSEKLLKESYKAIENKYKGYIEKAEKSSSKREFQKNLAAIRKAYSTMAPGALEVEGKADKKASLLKSAAAKSNPKGLFFSAVEKITSAKDKKADQSPFKTGPHKPGRSS